MISAELDATYRNAVYCVKDDQTAFTIRIGEYVEPAKHLMDAAKAEGALFITAFNPFGGVFDEVINAAANHGLKEELASKGLSILPGIGSSPDRTWTEDSYFVLPISRADSIGLCRKYRQNAVVFIPSSGVAELLYNPEVPLAMSASS